MGGPTKFRNGGPDNVFFFLVIEGRANLPRGGPSACADPESFVRGVQL